MFWQSVIELDKQLLLHLNGSESIFWDGVMMTATSTLTWIPLAFVLLYVLAKNNSIREVFLIVGMIALVILLADQISSSFFKPYFQRLRPTQDPGLMHQIDMVDGYRGGMYGFISSHAANTFSVFVYLSLLIRSKALSVSLLGWAMLASYTRIYLGVHFPGDILCGTLCGVMVGFLVYQLHLYVYRKISSNRSFFSTQYTSSGYAIHDVNILLSALHFTYIFVLMCGTWWWVTA